MAEWKKLVVSGSSISQLDNDAGYTTTTGTITEIATSAGLDGSGTSGKVTISPNFSEFTSMGSTKIVGTADELILLDSGAERRKTIDTIALSQFDNDLGWTTNVGDITGVTAGTGLSGGGASGDVTLALDFSELTDMTADIAGTTEFILQNGTVESRKAASEIKLSNFNNDQGWTANVGDITGVTAGTGLTGGGSSGTVTLNFDGFGTGVISGSGQISALGYTKNTGTVTSVSVGAGVGLSGGGSVTTSGTINLAVDLSELTDMTAAVNGAEDELILLDNGADRRKLISEITLSSFNNDQGWTSNVGDITGVTAGTGLSGGGATGDVTLNLDFSELTDMTGDITGLTEFILQDGATESRKAASEIKLSNFNNDAGWTANTGDITEVVAGVGLSGGATSGKATLTLDGTELSSHTFGDGTGTITINGNLSVSGTTTTIDTTNLNVSDQFITLNDGGSAADAGIVVEGQGASFGWDNSTARWAFDYEGATEGQTAIGADAFAVAVTTATTVALADSNYEKTGNMLVDSSADIWIYV